MKFIFLFSRISFCGLLEIHNHNQIIVKLIKNNEKFTQTNGKGAK